MKRAIVKYPRGRKVEVEVWADYEDGGFLAATLNPNSTVGYFLDPDGTVTVKVRFGTGINAGDVRETFDTKATWFLVDEEKAERVKVALASDYVPDVEGRDARFTRTDDGYEDPRGYA